MKITCFQDTDTLYIGFRSSDVAETRELDENTRLDIDAHGNLCGLIARDLPLMEDTVARQAAEGAGRSQCSLGVNKLAGSLAGVSSNCRFPLVRANVC